MTTPKHPSDKQPTDKNGTPYYGPRTLAEADELIQNVASGAPFEEQRLELLRSFPVAVAALLDKAGYTGFATSLREKYDILKIDDRVEGGEPGTEDYDTGRVDDIYGTKVSVAWDSGVTTEQDTSTLRRL